MKLSTCISAILVVAIIYLFSYVHSSPTHDYVTNTREKNFGGMLESLWRDHSGVPPSDEQKGSLAENLAQQDIKDYK